MELREYLFKHRISVNAFAEKLDCSRQYMSAILNGKVKPGKRLARDIEEATDGQVKCEDFEK